MRSDLENILLKEIFVKTGGRQENPQIAEVCAAAVEKYLADRIVSGKTELPEHIEVGERVTIPVAAVEFNVGSHTIWVQSLEGTIMRIKCTGKINVDKCGMNPTSHTDMIVNGDIEFCLSKDAVI